MSRKRLLIGPKRVKSDPCDVCGDRGIFGLCSACAGVFYGGHSLVHPSLTPLTFGGGIGRTGLNWWLDAKGINPDTHVTGGDLRPTVPEVRKDDVIDREGFRQRLGTDSDLHETDWRWREIFGNAEAR